MRKLLIITLLAALACSTKTPPVNKFSDAVLVKIYDLKDRRQTDSLINFLSSENPVYRRETALAFASVQDSAASLALGTSLLEDPDTLVKRNAAFALGQTGGTQAVNALIPSLENKERVVLREVLEALGKTIERNDLAVLSQLQSDDSLIQEGLAAGFYHLGVRKKADSVVTRRAATFLTNRFSVKTRLAAASYFARSSTIEGRGYEEKLIAAAQQDKSSDVRMAAVRGFRHLEQSEALYILNEIIESDLDYRVRVNAVSAGRYFSITEAEGLLFKGLKDSVEMVRVAAAEVINSNGEGYKGKLLHPAINDASSPRVKSNLYSAFFKTNPKAGIVEEIVRIYSKASSYYKSDLLLALGEARGSHETNAFEFIYGELLNDKNDKVVRSSAAAALVSMNTRKGTKIPASEFLKIYKQAILQSDVAVTGIVSVALMDKSLNYKEEIKDLSFLYEAKAKLSLPKDIESLQPLENSIAYLEGKDKPAALKNDYNHPIDWTFVKTIPLNQLVEIRTKKGTIVLRMLVAEAPGSVANFLTLVKQKYFDGKFFHRVVPNFVIQSGCNRGDGFGSEDYSIRSEFSMRRYSTGSVGMASAGKDTEGTQWFITHSNTPHLDGRYTIFAETMKGMNVVHKIEVGDKILDVTVKNILKR
ncbi:hypothetical protein BH10BAC4_BH10BAC4_13330 [soil metagenome]